MSNNKQASKINITVHLDEEKVPEKIEWEADESPQEGKQECKAFMLSLWDKEEKNTMRIDLWTKEMKVDEMKFLFYQTFMTMADSFQNATGEEKMTQEIRDFAKQFALKTKIADEGNEGEKE